MSKIKLLIVEDEVMFALMLSKILRRMGYIVFEPATTGEAALIAAQEHQPDVILMDIRLVGDMDGIEAAGKISAKRKIPIIFMTGYSDESIRSRAQAQHPAAYLIKPVTPADIMPILDGLFGG